MNNKEVTIISISVAAAVFLAFICGMLSGVKAMQKNAINAGVAHYTVNPTNGITQFEFKR